MSATATVARIEQRDQHGGEDLTRRQGGTGDQHHHDHHHHGHHAGDGDRGPGAAGGKAAVRAQPAANRHRRRDLHLDESRLAPVAPVGGQRRDRGRQQQSGPSRDATRSPAWRHQARHSSQAANMAGVAKTVSQMARSSRAWAVGWLAYWAIWAQRTAKRGRGRDDGQGAEEAQAPGGSCAFQPRSAHDLADGPGGLGARRRLGGEGARQRPAGTGQPVQLACRWPSGTSRSQAVSSSPPSASRISAGYREPALRPSCWHSSQPYRQVAGCSARASTTVAVACPDDRLNGIMGVTLYS